MTTMTLQEFVAYLPQMKKRVLNNVRSTMYVESNKIFEDIVNRSPLDKGPFRASWKLRSNRNGNAISSVRIQNDTPYGIFLDEGAEPGDVPWYWPNAKNKGPKSNSGKLKIVNGRIWAGGLSPQGFVVHGIVDVIIFKNPKRLRELAINVAQSVIGAI